MIIISSMLNDYLNWSKLGQAFKFERRDTTLSIGKFAYELQYGLTEEKASPKRLLDIVRSEWGIENGLHYRLDVTYE